MTEDDNIDKLFRDNLYQRNVEFDQKHWESAEKLIEADEKKKRNWFGRNMNLIFIGFAFFLTTCGILFYVFNADENETFTTSNPVILSPADKMLLSAANDVNSENESPEKITQKFNGSEISNSSLNSKSSTGTNKNIALNEASVKPDFQPGIPSENETLPTGNNVTVQKKINPPSGNNLKAAAGYTESKSGSFEAGFNKTDHLPVSQNQTINNEVIKKEPGLSLAASDNNNIEKNIPPETNSSGNEKENQGTPLINGANKDESEEDNVPESDIFLPSVITNNKESTPVEEGVPSQTSEKQEPNAPLKDRINWLRHVSAGINLGGDFSQGFVNTGTSRTGFSAAPIGGFRVACLLNEQVDLETGLVYDYRTGLNSRITTLTSRDISNNIAHYSTKTTISLHYLDFPVHLTYKYGKHSFILGMQYAQLISTRNKIIDSKEENGNTTIEKSIKQWSPNDGRFSSFDLAGIIGYDFAVTDRLKICGRFNYGLFDVTDDNSFGNSVRDKNNKFRIFIDYRFLKY